jgi:hypothetical protein
MKQILFTSTATIQPEYYPTPASKDIPDWYKKLESYMDNKKVPNGTGGTTGTIKKCIPVFDSITAGYLILLPADVFVTQKEGMPYYEWANYGLVEFHPVEQAPSHPMANSFPYPKWINPWAIKTPKGYSSLFVQPFHRESVFTILPGIVDTDNYSAPVNFPFVLNNPKFEGLIPAGTPIAQVIPVKRDNWVKKYGAKYDDSISLRLRTKFFDAYKTLFWQRKEYK